MKIPNEDDYEPASFSKRKVRKDVKVIRHQNTVETVAKPEAKQAQAT